jgi:hypothetical protein
MPSTQLGTLKRILETRLQGAIRTLRNRETIAVERTPHVLDGVMSGNTRCSGHNRNSAVRMTTDSRGGQKWLNGSIEFIASSFGPMRTSMIR